MFGLAALMHSGPSAAGQAGRGPAPLQPARHKTDPAFQIMAARPLGTGTPGVGSGRLDLDTLGAWNAEDIIVYARHHAARPANEDQQSFALGSVAISGSTKTDEIGSSRMTIAASLPVPGVPGLDAVANLSGGHDAMNPSTTTESASLIAGLRLKF